MERSMNRIELRGNVGQDARVNVVGSSTVARFNMATNEVFKDRNGNMKEETTWHSIVAWSGRGMPDLSRIKKGTLVYVIGRLRINKFITAEGEERQFPEILASRVSIVDTSVQPGPQPPEYQGMKFM